VLDAVIIPRHRPALPDRKTSPAAPLVVVLAGHVVLAVLMRRYPTIATGHAVLTLGVAVGLAAVTPWIETIAYAAAYVTGAEVLWRVTEARVPHEVGKYALILVLGIGLLRMGGRRRLFLPVAYLAVLLPSIVLTVDRLGLGAAREEVSFNLSGPAALAVAVLFFARLEVSWPVIRRLLWTMVVPIVAIAAVAAEATLAADRIVFGDSSNFLTSGGFGPNQVSAVLGLGALAGLVLTARETTLARRVLGLALAVWLLVQSVLTFSRGGLVNLVVALLIAAVYALREPRRAAGFVLPILAVSLFSGLFVYPRLVAFTNGALESRFTDTTLDERSRLVDADLKAFREHPLLGVGPGVGKEYRRLSDGRGVSAHTEFTRLLAEHGTAGIVAIGLLLAMVVTSYRQAPTRFDKAWVLVLAGWAVSEMSHGAMRFAAISFVFGLMACRIAHPQDVAADAADA